MSTDHEGSYAGYHTHRRKGETPCAACREALRVYVAEYRRRRPESKQRENFRRSYALRRLVDRHQDEFRALLIDASELADRNPDWVGTWERS